MGSAALTGAFCDLGHADSLAHLRVALAPRLLHYGLDDLDAGDIRRRAPEDVRIVVGLRRRSQRVDGQTVTGSATSVRSRFLRAAARA